MSGAVVQVAVGVIINAQNQVLISKRASDVHQANLWEFPGGKIEENETAELALSRELYEELDITVLQSQPFSKVTYDYGDKKVQLHIFLVKHYQGVASGKEKQKIKWKNINQLEASQFPAANVSIIKQLQLPMQLQITGNFQTLDELLNKSEVCIQKGIQLIQFRAHQLNDADYYEYAQSLLSLCHQYNVKLTLNRKPEALINVDADGLHLTRHELKNYSQRPCDDKKLLSVSCHNQQELDLAILLGADYCLLSPVKPAVSHNAGIAMGEQRFSEYCQSNYMPIVALGGMLNHDLANIQSLGGWGVASISEFWNE